MNYNNSLICQLQANYQINEKYIFYLSVYDPAALFSAEPAGGDCNGCRSESIFRKILGNSDQDLTLYSLFRGKGRSRPPLPFLCAANM